MPKTFNNLWEKIVSFENLYEAYKEARKGKRYRKDVLEFSYNLEENLMQIQESLINGTWKPGKYRTFYVFDPKKRLIAAPQFADRIVHHALVRVIEPLFEKKFIYNSYACRKGKGVHEAVLKLQRFLRIAKRNWGKVFVLKADISKYFPSIDHKVLFDTLKRTIRDKSTLYLCKRILDGYGDDGKSIPVGALTSQLFANIYLNQLDHYIKDQLGIKYYVRYMDDFIILLQDKSELRELLLCNIKSFLENKLFLKLNPKTAIFPANRGVDFAGYRTWATHILPRKRNVKKFRKKIKWMQKAFAAGRINLDYIKPRIASFLGYMKHCSSKTTLKHLLMEFVLIKPKISPLLEKSS